jgi:hypothetical protein
MIKSGSACLGRVLDRHASTVYISSRESWARGEEHPYRPVRASRGFEFSTRFSRGSAAAGSRRSILSMELRF